MVQRMVWFRTLVHILSHHSDSSLSSVAQDKKHLKNVGPIHHCEPPHAHSPDVASGTVERRLRIDVHDNADDDNDNAWQGGPLWPHGMGPITEYIEYKLLWLTNKVLTTTKPS